MSKNDKIKKEGRVFTPHYLVKDMLDFVGYSGDSILHKHIMENSAGDGAFLTEIVQRYCNVFFKTYSDTVLLKEHLEKYVHGIEKDEIEHRKCLANLNLVTRQYNINIDWDVVCKDTLVVADNYYNKMDFVVGNPPYVRVHNLGENYLATKKFMFSNGGMTDLYLVFFEIGLKMLSERGRMCLITPTSCLKSKAGIHLRKEIRENKKLSKIIDLGHFQPFDAAAYTMITMFDNSQRHSELDYFTYDPARLLPVFQCRLSYDSVFIDNKIYLADKEKLATLWKIENHYKNTDKKSTSVKNGLATLADDIFIGHFNFSDKIIDVIKASTGERLKCIFPYNAQGAPLKIEEIKDDSGLYKYLAGNKKKLEKRSISNKDEWYLFGRTQALKDIAKEKISINQLIKDKKSLKIHTISRGEGVFSGLYILSEAPSTQIKKILTGDNFIDYIKLLKNYKSGGYYSFSSKELEKFLTYELDKNDTTRNEFNFLMRN